jgi:hypothetical protein
VLELVTLALEKFVLSFVFEELASVLSLDELVVALILETIVDDGIFDVELVKGPAAMLVEVVVVAAPDVVR